LFSENGRALQTLYQAAAFILICAQSEGVRMMQKKLGFGLMRLPLLNEKEAGSIDLEQTEKMVDIFMERGFTYFDTAWMYCGGESENAAREALVERYPRDSYTLATKLHAAFIKEKADRDKVFEEQRRKTGVTYFDYYLLHDIEPDTYVTYNKLDCFTWLKEKKEQGLVKKMGFSFHGDAKLLEQVLSEHPEMDFVQLQINYLDWDSDTVQSRMCYDLCVKYNKPVVVMEPVKGGTLAKVPKSVEKLFQEQEPQMSVPSWAVRFAASLDQVFMVLSGMSTIEQLEDNTGYMMDFQSLDEKEMDCIWKAADLIKHDIAIPCTGCSYCTDGCPMHIAIPRYFSLYNTEKKIVRDSSWKSQKEEYAELTKTFGKASVCVGCGQCEGICPQHLPIIEHLKEVAGCFEQ
jgi:hypothetical protein